jgi:hypothetical protein
VLVFAALTTTTLTGCFEGSVLDQEAEWAAGIETYYIEAREIADRYRAADETFDEMADTAMTGTLSQDELQVMYDANAEMTAADQDWLTLEVPDPELRDPHLQVEEAMRLMRQADKELILAIEGGIMAKVSDSHAQAEAAEQLVEDALAEVEAWYSVNETRIQRGLRNADPGERTSSE